MRRRADGCRGWHEAPQWRSRSDRVRVIAADPTPSPAHPLSLLRHTRCRRRCRVTRPARRA
eukprot:262799-Prymnesium_polylepis.2